MEDYGGDGGGDGGGTVVLLRLENNVIFERI